MFNYFLENNDIFKAIRKEDVEEFQRLQNSSFIETMNAFLTTFVVTAITSEYIIPRYMPKFHIQSFRTVLVAIKYFVFPGYVAKKYRLF